MPAGRVPLHVELSCCSCTYMPAGLVYLLPQTQLLFKYAYWLRDAAKWMLAGPLPLNRHACRSFDINSSMSAGVVFLHLPYMLVWYLTISRACWCGASL